MRREERVTVQGPVKEQQPDGMSHGGCPRPQWLGIGWAPWRRRGGCLRSSSNPPQHAKGRTGDCPGPRKGATTRRNVSHRGGGGWGTTPPFQRRPPYVPPLLPGPKLPAPPPPRLSCTAPPLLRCCALLCPSASGSVVHLPLAVRQRPPCPPVAPWSSAASSAPRSRWRRGSIRRPVFFALVLSAPTSDRLDTALFCWLINIHTSD